MQTRRDSSDSPRGWRRPGCIAAGHVGCTFTHTAHDVPVWLARLALFAPSSFPRYAHESATLVVAMERHALGTTVAFICRANVVLSFDAVSHAVLSARCTRSGVSTSELSERTARSSFSSFASRLLFDLAQPILTNRHGELESRTKSHPCADGETTNLQRGREKEEKHSEKSGLHPSTANTGAKL